jgi:hypothetical protein
VPQESQGAVLLKITRAPRENADGKGNLVCDQPPQFKGSRNDNATSSSL